jgi:hypothetical protein
MKPFIKQSLLRVFSEGDLMEDYGEFDINQLKVMMREHGTSNTRRLIVELFQRLDAAYQKLDGIQEMIENMEQDDGSLNDALNDLKNPPIRQHPIPGVSDELAEGIYSRIYSVINEKLSFLDGKHFSSDSPIVQFYIFILESVDVEEHHLLQKKYLNMNGIRKWSNHLKFMHPTRYFDSKFNFATRMGLLESTELQILEIGCRGGHFISIANFLGHNGIGLEDDSELYQDLCKVLNVPFIDGTVMDNGELPLLEQAPFDLITALSITFNKKQGVPWGSDTWDYFISNIKNQWLKAGGQMIIQLPRNSTSDIVWEHLSSVSEASDHSKMEIIISN